MATANKELEGRIPADRIVDFDVYNPDLEGIGFDQSWIALRDRSRSLMWTNRNGGHWIVTRGELMRSVLADYERFSSKVLMVPREFGLDKLLPVSADPPEHRQYRSLINKAFAPATIRGVEDFVKEYTISLVERLRPRGGCDFMTDFAHLLPIVIFFRLADLPMEHHEYLNDLMGQVLHPVDSASQAEGFEKFTEYLLPVIHARRAAPGSDVLSSIVQGTINGEAVTDEEAIKLSTALIVGGLDTTLALMSFTMNYLTSDPGLRHLLASQPDRIPDAVDEFVRRFPIGVNTREVRIDHEADGVMLRAGDLITTPQILHGLDDREYPNPEKVDIDRSTGGNSAFGHGIHRCPGSFLAKTELRILLAEWLPRIPDFEIEPGAKVVVVPGITAGFHHLPLRWNPNAGAA